MTEETNHLTGIARCHPKLEWQSCVSLGYTSAVCGECGSGGVGIERSLGESVFRIVCSRCDTRLACFTGTGGLAKLVQADIEEITKASRLRMGAALKLAKKLGFTSYTIDPLALHYEAIDFLLDFSVKEWRPSDG